MGPNGGSHLDYGAAIQAGYTPDEISQFAQQNGLSIANQPDPTTTPQAAPMGNISTPPQANTPESFSPDSPFAGVNLQQTNQQPKNSWADWLPTVGAVLGGIGGAAVPIGGETGLTEVGGAALGSSLGETAKEWLQGKPLDAKDIVVQGALGGVGQGVGGLLAKGVTGLAGAAASKMAGRAADLTGQLTPDTLPQVLHSVVPKDANYMDNLGKLLNISEPLVGKTPQEALPIVKEGITSLDSQIKALPDMQNSFDTASALKNFRDYLPNNTGYVDTPEYNSLVQNAEARINSLGGTGEGTPSQILGPDGNPISYGATGNPTLMDAYNMKSSLANNLLDNAFKKNDMGTTLTPKEDINMALWQSLKNELDSQGTPLISKMNSQQHGLFDIGKALAKNVGKGGKAGAFSVKDILPMGVGDVAASAMGANPLIGMAAGAAADMATKSPEAMAAGANAAGKLAGNSIMPKILGGAGAAVGTGVGDLVNGETGGNGTGTGAGGSGMERNPQEFQKTLPQGVTVDQQGNVSLPPLQAHIAPQMYPMQNYIADRQKAIASGDLIGAENLDKMFQASQDNAKNYIDRNGLDAEEQSTLRDAPNLVYLANRVRQEMQGVSPNILNSSNVVNTLRSYNNPQYAQLASDISVLNDNVARNVAGGVLRGMDLKAVKNPTMSDSFGSANSKLDSIIQRAAERYMNLAPKYGLNTATGAPLQ